MVGAMLVLLLSVVAPASAHLRVLVYGPSGSGEADWMDYGDEVVVWDEDEWRAASTSDFMDFDALVVGDSGCSPPTAGQLDALIDTRSTWAPVVAGNILVTSLATGCHMPTTGAPFESTNKILNWVGGPDVGLWVSTGASFEALSALDGWGAFEGSASTTDTVRTTDLVSGLWGTIGDADVSGWGPSAWGVFTDWPDDWLVAVEDGDGQSVGLAFLACDSDFDGYDDIRCGGLDCDDTTTFVRPGRDETCDGRDNDCDTLVDEDPIDADAWYRDLDGDGFGDVEDMVLSCTPLTGRVTNDEDCLDTDEGVFPDAPELCDAIDNNCHGERTSCRSRYVPGTETGTATVTEPQPKLPRLLATPWIVASSEDCSDNPSSTRMRWTSVRWRRKDMTEKICVILCRWLAGSACGGEDCDDACSGCWPGAEEVLCDGITKTVMAQTSVMSTVMATMQPVRPGLCR